MSEMQWHIQIVNWVMASGKTVTSGVSESLLELIDRDLACSDLTAAAASFARRCSTVR